MIASALSIAALAALFGWILGGVVLRLAGLTVAAAGLFGAVISGESADVLISAIGLFLWLAGHWHYAQRRQEYKSPLARHLFCRLLPARLDPTRGWVAPVIEERPGRASSARRPEARGRLLRLLSALRPQARNPKHKEDIKDE